MYRFFDGDGTLWYPKSTKWNKRPHWIYEENKDEAEYLSLLTLTPGVKQILRQLRQRGVVTVCLSTHPHPPEEARMRLEKKIRHFELEHLFEEYYATPDVPEGKGLAIVRVLSARGIGCRGAVMVGDSYTYDWLSAKCVGVEALLMRTDYTRSIIRKKCITKYISRLSDILDVLI